MKKKKKYIKTISFLFIFVFFIFVYTSMDFVFANSKIENSIASINDKDDGITICIDKT